MIADQTRFYGFDMGNEKHPETIDSRDLPRRIPQGRVNSRWIAQNDVAVRTKSGTGPGETRFCRSQAGAKASRNSNGVTTGVSAAPPLPSKPLQPGTLPSRTTGRKVLVRLALRRTMIGGRA
jgi:hypothetical protein